MRKKLKKECVVCAMPLRTLEKINFIIISGGNRTLIQSSHKVCKADADIHIAHTSRESLKITQHELKMMQAKPKGGYYELPFDPASPVKSVLREVLIDANTLIQVAKERIRTEGLSAIMTVCRLNESKIKVIDVLAKIADIERDRAVKSANDLPKDALTTLRSIMRDHPDIVGRYMDKTDPGTITLLQAPEPKPKPKKLDLSGNWF